ncbi:phytase [Penicillium capsulatum]|uniref:Phytase A n=1 Tax=Penicillium capsulatum TaxID=69766 RepID=A0A9W9I7H2_9EURO|nr:phytase [Penicillium capsulatum]KAJ6136626.1 phytase [Penicillium capsulatum]
MALTRSPEEESLLGTKPASRARGKTVGTVILTALLGLVGIYFLIGLTRQVWSQIQQDRAPIAVMQHHRGGYGCFPEISHHWGQYSPYFSLEDEGIHNAVPSGCELIFAQVLSRHGARFPTQSKSETYQRLVTAIQSNATAFLGKYAFLRDLRYTWGSDHLTALGERQMVNSGIKFYTRYQTLARDHVPFVRSSGASRVIASGKKFIHGFQRAKSLDREAEPDSATPQISVILSEDSGTNNTLNHNTCPQFEASNLEDNVRTRFTGIFAPPIKRRIEAHLPGVHLRNEEVPYLMDLCAFDTVSATADGSVRSAWCDLFTEAEWAQYDYLQSLGKYYGFGGGNPLGPAQGIGFVNELIARLTNTPVHDETTTNHTLDDSRASSFPLNRTLYADFTHDNGMIPIFFALGLYNHTARLPQTHVQSVHKADGYSAAWTVPFGARAYIEMMQCQNDPDPEPLVRVLVNDRVVPLHGCPVDQLGRCRRKEFIHGLSFARSGGNWKDCFA